MDNHSPHFNETDDDKSDIRAQLLSLEASLAEKEQRVSQLEVELSAVQAKCKVYKKECKQLSKELRCRRQDVRDYLKAAKRCRIYEKSESCKCHCHELQSVERDTQTFATDFCSVDSSSSALDWVPSEGTGLTIADVVKEAVNSVSQSSDYVYDENSKLYYSVSTGYYYDPIQKLFYEPHSRTYYSYDERKMTYHFHSQLQDTSQPESKRKLKRRKKKDSKVKKSEKVASDLEEGEISSDSNGSKSTGIDGSSVSETSEEEDPNNYPPSIRLIVKKSEKLQVGSLLLVTCDGASVGRAEENGVCLLDNGISRTHARIEYNSDRACYLVYDQGSQNGTFVNQNRLAEPKIVSSEGCELHHGDWITFGSTEFVAHIHRGHDTCDQCEPGLLLQAKEEKKVHMILSKEEREEIRKHGLRELKKKYALSDYDPEKHHRKGYTDRAERRRKTVGSNNPYEKDAEPSSVDKPVSAENQGFKMLQKLGWKEGESLGQGDSGRTEPVNAYEDGQIGRAGLGTRTAYKELCSKGNVQIVIVPNVSSNVS